MSPTRYVFSTTDVVHYRLPTHTNDLIMDRSEAETSEVFMVIMQPGESPPMHVHHDTEQVFYVLSGTGMLQIGTEQPHSDRVKVGDLVRIPPSTPHQIRCDSTEPLTYLCVDCFVGGRPEEEPTWDSHVRVMCELNGWDYDSIVADHSGR